ncbi:MAG: M1 family metallopeptidase [Chloroflexi bacterium]|nr:M1 family metallopeptidase [Chloroflexota bacterium]
MTNYKPTRKLVLLLCAVCLLAACSPPQEEIPTPTPSITPTATATATLTPTPVPSPTPTPLPLDGKQTQYRIDATINYYNRFISVTSQSIFTNKTNVPIDEMVFIVYPTIFQSIFMRSVKLGDGTPVDDYRWEGHHMVIPLETPLQPGEQITITHDFELYMPDRTGVFGQTGRQLLLSYWYPTIPPFDEQQGWLAYDVSLVNSMFVGEHQVFESADYDVTIKFTDRAENMVIAAGAMPVFEDDSYRISLPLGRTFVLAISDSYKIITREVDGVQIRGFSLPEVVESSEVAVDLAEKALRLYSELFGPYERDVLSVVQADMGINMEFDGLILIQSSFYWLYRDPPRSDLHIIVPHEVLHQWFFSLVGNNQAMEPWLDEAIATYAEALFYERYFPEDLEWWWDTRVHAHLPAGSIDTSIYIAGGVPEYFNRAYRRGALFYRDLREAIGDEIFFSFLLDYAQSHRYKIATGEGFFNTLNQHTNADYSTVIEEYFTNPPGAP